MCTCQMRQEAEQEWQALRSELTRRADVLNTPRIR
jgi:hypothetical protein